MRATDHCAKPYEIVILGLAPQALCFRLLRRLRVKRKHA